MRGSLLLCLVGLALVSRGAQLLSKDALALNKDTLALNVSQEPTNDYSEQEAEERDDMLDAADSGSEVDVNAAIGASNTDDNMGVANNIPDAQYPTEETTEPESVTGTSTETTTKTEVTGNVADIDELPSTSMPEAGGEEGAAEPVKSVDADDISEMSMQDACAACVVDGCPGHSCYTAKSEVDEGLESRPRFSWNCWNSSNAEFVREDVPPVGFTRCSAVHQGSLAKKQTSVQDGESVLLRMPPQHHRVSLGHQLAALYRVMDRNKDQKLTFGEVMNTLYMERVMDFKKAHPQVVKMLIDWFEKAPAVQRTHGVSLPEIVKLVESFLHTKLGDVEKEKAQLIETEQQVKVGAGNFVTHVAACRACFSLDRCGSLGRCVAGPANTNPSFNWACGRLVGFKYTDCEGSSGALMQRYGDDDVSYGDTTDNKPVTNDPDADKTQAGGGQQVEGVSSQSQGGDGGAGDGGGFLL